MKAVVFGLSGTVFDVNEGQYRMQQGTDELLRILKRLGIKTVAYAPNDSEGAEQLLQSGLDQHFYAVVADRNDARSPLAGLSTLLEEIQVAPGEAMVVGHSVADMWLGKDIQSAKVVGLAKAPAAAAALRTAGADYVVADIPSLLDVIE
jgi:phosphoglycolate phosphatase-like HAD superfamily hydrolase